MKTFKEEICTKSSRSMQNGDYTSLISMHKYFFNLKSEVSLFQSVQQYKTTEQHLIAQLEYHKLRTEKIVVIHLKKGIQK